MSGKVYFANVRAKNAQQSRAAKIAALFDKAGFAKLISPGALTAVKLHFGEEGNTAFIPPNQVRPVADKILACGGKPFLTDTNTLYKGSRHNSVDHLRTALRNGFGTESAGAPIVIADGLLDENSAAVEVGLKHFKKVEIAGAIARAQSMLVLSHFKGHIMAGFGGAIKNLAMGCATASGKREQHCAKPFILDKKCVGCGVCAHHCPKDAITVKNRKASINMENCIGCGECMAFCQAGAVELDWKTDIKDFTERIVEYAYGAAHPKKGKIGFINFLVNITPECDCFGWSDSPVVPDIGILASTDPVAIDRASYDLVNKQTGLHGGALEHNHAEGADKFKALHEYTLGERQLSYGEEIGLGSNKYELVEL